MCRSPRRLLSHVPKRSEVSTSLLRCFLSIWDTLGRSDAPGSSFLRIEVFNLCSPELGGESWGDNLWCMMVGGWRNLVYLQDLRLDCQPSRDHRMQTFKSELPGASDHPRVSQMLGKHHRRLVDTSERFGTGDRSLLGFRHTPRDRIA